MTLRCVYCVLLSRLAGQRRQHLRTKLKQATLQNYGNFYSNIEKNTIQITAIAEIRRFKKKAYFKSTQSCNVIQLYGYALNFSNFRKFLYFCYFLTSFVSNGSLFVLPEVSNCFFKINYSNSVSLCLV